MKMEKSDYSATPHVINMDVIGPVTVYVQGDLEKFRDGVAFMTIHSAGSSFNSWLDFAGDLNMEDIRKRYTVTTRPKVYRCKGSKQSVNFLSKTQCNKFLRF